MFLPGRSEHRLRPTTLECSSSHREQTRLFSTFVTRPFSFYHTPIIAKSRFWNLEQIAFPNRATISLPSQKFLRSFPFFPPFFLSLFLSFFLFFLFFLPPITDKRNSENVDPFFEERIQISLLSTSRAKLPRESSSSSIINQSPTVIFHVKYFREQSKLVRRR